MRSWKRRTAIYLAVLLGSMTAFALLYWWGMAALEGDEKSLLHSFRFVIETYTTIGYGSDSPWESDAMNVIVGVMGITGMAMIFLALPTFVLPAIRDAIESAVPRQAPEGLEDHVVIVSHSPRMPPLTEELDSWDVEYVVVEPDREQAREFFEDGETVVYAEPDRVEGLEAANTGDARALLVDVADKMDASIVLTARELDESLRVISVVEEPHREPYHRLAGADEVVSPRPLVGERLAAMVTTTVTTDLGEGVELGEDFRVFELPVPRDSDLVGSRIDESGLRERAGVNVIGAWFQGEFKTPPPPDAEIAEGTVLLVAGHQAAIDRLADLSVANPRPHSSGETIVVGHGEVGRSVTRTLDAAGLRYTVVDREDRPDVDVVGEATDPDPLRRAGIDDATSIVLAIPEDAETEYATLVARNESHEVNVAARADDASSVRKLYRAGADYVLSLDTVTGRMLASAVLEGADVLSTDTHVEVVRVGPGTLAGRTLGDADVRRKTGCTVVAIERDDEVLTELGPDFGVRDDDALIVAGTDDGINRFTERYE
jgi:Trk K+ transport system NAD-binding subunit